MPGEYVIRWTGGRIGAGASVFHMRGTDSPSAAFAAANACRGFFDAIKAHLPLGVTLTPDAEFKNLTAEGVLTSVVPLTAPATVTGTGSGAWANGQGCMIRWNTPAVVSGRRLLGRTYVVPLLGSAFTGGNMNPTIQANIGSAASTLISSLASNGTPLQVWSKAHSVTADVIGGTVPARPQSLRTRNDRE